MGTTVMVGNGSYLRGKLFRQSLIVHSGTPHLGDAQAESSPRRLLCPARSRQIFKAHRMSLHVLLIVGSLGDPDVGDRQLQRRVGIGENGDPFVAWMAAP